MPPVDDASEQDATTPAVGPNQPPVDAEHPPVPPSPWDAPSPQSGPAPAASPWAPPPSSPPTSGQIPPSPYQLPPSPYQVPYQHQGPQQGPYPGPYNWSPVPGGAPQEYNGLAIASAIVGVFGFACCLWVVAGGLGITALGQIRQRNQKGRGLAITGIVMSGVWFVALVAFAVFAAEHGHTTRSPSPAFTSGADASGWHTSVFNLSAGDCFDRTSTDQTAGLPPVDLTECTDPHDGEVFGEAELATGTYPGKDGVVSKSDDGCLKLLDTYVMDTWSLPKSVDVHYFYPDAISWHSTAANHSTCILVSSDHKKLTGSLRRDSSNLTPDQVSYLTSVKLLNDVGANSPDSSPSDDPAAYRAWAGEVSNAITQEISALQAHNWPAGPDKPVAALVAELKLSQPHWKAAHQSTDDATLNHELAQASRHFGHEQAKAARAALGLATTDERDSGTGSGTGNSTGAPQSV